MVLIRPDDSDIDKINSEINQIVNQRYLITTFAITVFGVIAAWQIPSESEQKMGILSYFISLILLTFLFFLFIYSWTLKKQLRIFSAYLVVTEKSNWEKDWRKYRENNKWYLGYTKTQSIIFLFLIIISGLLPFIYIGVSKLEPNCPLEICIVILTLIFSFVVILLGILGNFDSERIYVENWTKIADEPDPATLSTSAQSTTSTTAQPPATP